MTKSRHLGSASQEDRVVFLAPLINSVAGITIDLFAPSMPAIGREFGVTQELMQNTITITLLFYALGQIFFGLLADSRGRRPSILVGLALFLAGSACAAAANSIELLLFARALQGFGIGACQIVARAVLVDRLHGERFRVAVVYLSLAFGLGPVVAPWIGGLVQEDFGWRWNFGLYFVYGVFVLICVYVWLEESLAAEARRPLGKFLSSYRIALTDRRFLAAVFLLGASFASFLTWNVVGPYLVQVRLGRSSSAFGTSALLVGCGYLIATMLNRLLVRRISASALIVAGLVLQAIGIGVLVFGGEGLVWWSLQLGTVAVAFSQGFVFSNSLAKTMMLFPTMAGIAASLQGCLMLLIGTAASAVMGKLTIDSNLDVARIFAVLLALALVSAGALLLPGTSPSVRSAAGDRG